MQNAWKERQNLLDCCVTIQDALRKASTDEVTSHPPLDDDEGNPIESQSESTSRPASSSLDSAASTLASGMVDMVVNEVSLFYHDHSRGCGLSQHKFSLLAKVKFHNLDTF